MDAKKATAVVEWVERIEKSALSVSKFFETHDIPFSRAQYFIYKRRLEESGSDGLIDKRGIRGNRKITHEQKVFLKGCLCSNSDVSLGWLQQMLVEEFGCEVNMSTVSRALTRISPDRELKVGGRPKTRKQNTI
jgi:transposase